MCGGSRRHGIVVPHGHWMRVSAADLPLGGCPVPELGQPVPGVPRDCRFPFAVPRVWARAKRGNRTSRRDKIPADSEGQTEQRDLVPVCSAQSGSVPIGGPRQEGPLRLDPGLVPWQRPWPDRPQFRYRAGLPLVCAHPLFCSAGSRTQRYLDLALCRDNYIPSERSSNSVVGTGISWTPQWMMNPDCLPAYRGGSHRAEGVLNPTKESLHKHVKEVLR